MILHGYWRSGTSYRTRIALNLKGLAYETAPVDLRTGAQKSDAYLALNPQGLVPALETDDGLVLTQSPAILEWLEETHPAPPLLPASAAERAQVRAMAALIAKRCWKQDSTTSRGSRSAKMIFAPGNTRLISGSTTMLSGYLSTTIDAGCSPTRRQ